MSPKNRLRMGALISSLLILALVGCIHVSGPSSGKLKKNLVKSWLFKSTDLFYPADSQGASSYPTLSKQSIGSLERDINLLLKSVLELHRRNSTLAGTYFNQAVPAVVDGVAILDNQGLPIAKSFMNESGKLEIRIDVRVLQATFRGSLVAAIRADEFGGSSQQDDSDDVLLANFLDFKKDVSKAKAGNMLGDLIGAMHSDDFDNDRWFKMADFAEKGDQIQSRYVGTLMFLLAHELGHFVLNHYREGCDLSKCDRFAERERQADKYAGILLGALLAPLGEFGEDSFFPFSNLSGIDVFFNDAYGRIGFVDPKSSSCACPYPSPEERRLAADSGRQYAASEYVRLLSENSKAAESMSPAKMRPPKRRSHGDDDL